ncbi:hypothetical protein CIB84_000309, partial [Bambusicola thoracicus]
YQKLLSQAVGMHKHSENMNDPFRLSAVLNVLFAFQKLFDACEKDIEKRKIDILKILGFSSLYNDANTCKQEQMLDIMKLLRDGYYHNDLCICEIIKSSYKAVKTVLDFQQADVPLRSTDLKQFAQKCCRVFCLLLLQDSPVTAVWNLSECPPQYLDHVDQQDIMYRKKTELRVLWPILADGKNVIERGVVCDEM